MYRIMLVDDEENILKALKRLLSQGSSGGGRSSDDFGMQIETFTRPEDALKRAEDVAFDLVISDYRMPGMDGVSFLRSLRALQPHVARLILSGYADLDGLIGAINEAQIFRFISKPWHDFDVQTAVAQALAHRALLLENQRLADLVRRQQGKLTRQEYELRRLEEENPGITRVNWGPNGEVLMDDAEA